MKILTKIPTQIDALVLLKKRESKIKTSLIIQLKKSLVMLARMDAGGSVKRRLAFDQEAN